jgi:hypothetical protein
MPGSKQVCSVEIAVAILLFTVFSLVSRGLVYSGTADYIVPFTGSRAWVYGLGMKASKPWHSWSMPGSKQVCSVENVVTILPFLVSFFCITGPGVQRDSRLHRAFHWQLDVGAWAGDERS